MFEGMNEELVEVWFGILRDSNSKQAHGCLCDSSRAKCCLGHLLDAMYGKDPNLWREYYDTSLPEYFDDKQVPIHHDNNSLMGSLDERNLMMAGLNADEQGHLARLNDTMHSLLQIADIVEKGRAHAKTV
jgi:hypothetical protein